MDIGDKKILGFKYEQRMKLAYFKAHSIENLVINY